uniref:Uncharacterized protein n=1 Tax=Piliocolobus tephrosceles TaxID=591936 RepID=A0A8C9M0Z9_9PRIM
IKTFLSLPHFLRHFTRFLRKGPIDPALSPIGWPVWSHIPPSPFHPLHPHSCSLGSLSQLNNLHTSPCPGPALRGAIWRTQARTKASDKAKPAVNRARTIILQESNPWRGTIHNKQLRWKSGGVDLVSLVGFWLWLKTRFTVLRAS